MGCSCWEVEGGMAVPGCRKGPGTASFWGNSQEPQSPLKSRSPTGSEGGSWLTPWLSKGGPTLPQLSPALEVELGFPGRIRKGQVQPRSLGGE